MALKPVTPARVVVSLAGTAVALSSTQLLVKNVVVQAENGNTGLIYLGGSDVDSTNGYELSAGLGIALADLQSDIGKGDYIDLAQVYVDAATNADAIRVLYLAREI
jgi:hypothetical protein